MDKLISVVVPSYNAVCYLPKGCSVWEGIIKKTNLPFEILIVNDGSTDDTQVLAEKYQQLYPDYFRVIKKENGGHGSAVNCGITNAHGRYFMIVDADDWVDEIEFVQLLELISTINTAPDVVLSDANKCTYETYEVIGQEKVTGISGGEVLPMEEALKSAKNLEMHNFCVRTEILKNLIKKDGFVCHENHFYVDNEFVLKSLLNSQSVYYTGLTVYQYLLGREGQSVNIVSRRKNSKQYVEVAEFLMDYYNRQNINSPILAAYCTRKIAYFISGIYSEKMSYGPNRRNESREWLKCYDRRLKESQDDIYFANTNICIKLLRMSNFLLFPAASMVYRLVNHIDD